jgi:hypothetical protein
VIICDDCHITLNTAWTDCCGRWVSTPDLCLVGRVFKHEVQLLLLRTFIVWHGYVLREEGTASQGLTPAHCISLILYLTSYILHVTPYTLCLTSYVLHLTSYILHLTPHTLRLTSYILHFTPYILRLTSYILHLTSYILHLTSYILHLISYIISYRILYRVTCIRLVCKTYPWSDASTIRQKHLFTQSLDWHIPWSRVNLEKSILTQLIEKYRACCGVWCIPCITRLFRWFELNALTDSTYISYFSYHTLATGAFLLTYSI